MADSPTVAVYNHPSSGVSDADAERWTAACAKQVEQFGELWHTEANVHFVPSSKKPRAGSWVIAMLGTSDVAGALGYHDLTPDGLPLGKVFAATDLLYGETVSVTLSHELLEILGDPWINLAAQASDGKFYAWETCDAVEADALAYEIDGVLVSNWVTPAWFGNGDGLYDFRGELRFPLELAAGGYIAVFDPASGRGWTQVTGARKIRDIAHATPRVGSRRERRFRRAGGGVWLPSTYETG